MPDTEEKEETVVAYTVGAIGYNRQIAPHNTRVTLPKSVAEEYLAMGAVRKPTKTEREAIDKEKEGDGE